MPIIAAQTAHLVHFRIVMASWRLIALTLFALILIALNLTA
jgi:hypothetical protein